jgi:ABC-type sulfate transport system permease subunit
MINTLAFLMQSDAGNAPSRTGVVISTVIWVAVIILMIAAMWKVFDKAGEPGWAAIIPIYNLIVLLKIAGRPLWWILLFIIPLVNFIIGIVVAFDIAKRFGKGAGFALGLVFLPFIFYPVLAWGDARYQPQPAMA